MDVILWRELVILSIVVAVLAINSSLRHNAGWAESEENWKWQKSGGVADKWEGCEAIQSTLDGLELGANRNFMKFSEENCKALHLRRNVQYMLGDNQLVSKEDRGPSEVHWLWASNMPLWQSRLMVSWAALGRALTACRGIRSTQQWWGHTCRAVFSSGLFSTERDTGFKVMEKYISQWETACPLL